MPPANLYKGYKNDNPAGNRLVTVQTGDDETPLPHLVRHSPDGFSWGYPEPRPDLYQKFKFDVIAGLDPNDDWIIDADFVTHWLDQNQ